MRDSYVSPKKNDTPISYVELVILSLSIYHSTAQRKKLVRADQSATTQASTQADRCRVPACRRASIAARCVLKTNEEIEIYAAKKYTGMQPQAAGDAQWSRLKL